MQEYGKRSYIMWSLFWRASRENAITLRALLIRDIMIRYKREGLGFAWLILEPMILTVMVMLLWRLMYGADKQGIAVLPLVLTGYSFLTLWRHIVGRSIFVLKLGVDLKYHRAIQYGDIVVSRYLLEFLAVQLAFWIVYVVLFLVGAVMPIYDLFLVSVSWLLFGFLAIGLGLIIVATTELFESSEKFITPIMYVTIPLTGAFYMVAWMPYGVQQVLLWSPMVHGVEMLRAGVFGPKVPTVYDASYLFLFGLFANGIGWALFNVAKTRVEPLT
jgi:capsular polysaccharide transport system permease protein